MRTIGKLIHETFRNASVIKSTNVTTSAPLTRPFQCGPVGGRASGVPLYMHNQITFFGQIKFTLKNVFTKISFPCQIPEENTLT